MAAMLETPVSEPMTSLDEAVASKAHLEALQAELKLARAQIASLKFEVARLKHWRFGSSSESLDTGARQDSCRLIHAASC